MELATQLEHRYRTALESGSDPEFYQHIHQYCDLVMTNPVLNGILEKDQRDYTERHSAIWRDRAKTDEEADEKAVLTMRLERFSMYCDFATLEMRVYYPIEDYKHSTEPDDKQDPVALLMLRGIKNMRSTRWSKKTLETYNRWFDGKRPIYESDLRKFHGKMVAALGAGVKPAEEKPARPRVPLSLDPRTGDFLVNGTEGNLNPTGQEYKVFRRLCNNPEYLASYLELIQAYRPNIEQATKPEKYDLSKIINALKMKLGAQRNIIKNVKGVGYRLVFPSQEND